MEAQEESTREISPQACKETCGGHVMVPTTAGPNPTSHFENLWEDYFWDKQAESGARSMVALIASRPPKAQAHGSSENIPLFIPMSRNKSFTGIKTLLAEL
ncbi:unnamed protein product [Linum trigynum]|uniref:Uncharacterized protein n=1 Tax=Linum trigynum TaxID=586398 RepID=A0AAV2DED1_9ROSI